MWRSKKFIIAAVLMAVVLIGSIGGVVLANSGDAANEHKPILSRVAEILGIDQQSLEDAFTQARKEMRADMLQDLVDQGKITQEEADQYSERWQSRPKGLSGFGPHGHRGFHGRGGCFGPGGMNAPPADTSFAY